MAHTDQELLAMWRSDRRIEAIKIFRAERNAPLMHAKSAMEALDAGSPQPFKPTPEIACNMSLRDYFAGQALAGYFAAPHTPHQGAANADTAAYVYAMADAMLAERSK